MFVPFCLLALSEEERNEIILQIYSKYKNWMICVANRLLKDTAPSYADDAVHNVILGLTYYPEKVPSIDNENKLKAYLFVCLKNAVFKITKSNPHFLPLNEGVTYTHNDHIIDDLSLAEQKKQIENFIYNLNPIYSDVLVLYILFDLNTKEIASLLNIRLSTVSTRLQRGKKLIRKQFGVKI